MAAHTLSSLWASADREGRRELAVSALSMAYGFLDQGDIGSAADLAMQLAGLPDLGTLPDGPVFEVEATKVHLLRLFEIQRPEAEQVAIDVLKRHGSSSDTRILGALSEIRLLLSDHIARSSPARAYRLLRTNVEAAALPNEHDPGALVLWSHTNALIYRWRQRADLDDTGIKDFVDFGMSLPATCYANATADLRRNYVRAAFKVLQAMFVLGDSQGAVDYAKAVVDMFGADPTGEVVEELAPIELFANAAATVQIGIADSGLPVLDWLHQAAVLTARSIILVSVLALTATVAAVALVAAILLELHPLVWLALLAVLGTIGRWLVPAARSTAAGRARVAKQAERCANAHATAVRAHRRAVQTIARSAFLDEPLCVYLRGFATEMAMGPVVNSPGRGLQRVVAAGSRSELIDRDLAAALPDAAIVGLQNRYDIHHDATVPKLLVPDQQWVEIVSALVMSAAAIVVDCTEPSPGLATELLLLSADDTPQRTAVVLHRWEPPPLHIEAITKALGGMDPGVAARSTLDEHNRRVAEFEALLQPFPHTFQAHSADVVDFVRRALEDPLMRFPETIRIAEPLLKTVATDVTIPELLDQGTKSVSSHVWNARHSLGPLQAWVQE